MTHSAIPLRRAFVARLLSGAAFAGVTMALCALAGAHRARRSGRRR